MDLLEVLQGPVNRHPWEISRAESLLRLIKKRPDYRYVDVGSGDQFLAHIVAVFRDLVRLKRRYPSS